MIEAIRQFLAVPANQTDGTRDGLQRPIALQPATRAAVEQAERDLGFSLPPLLRDLLISIGNGGFGPGCGLIGVAGGFNDDGHDLVSRYQGFRQPDPSDPLWHWPQELLPAAHLGCAMYACIDVRVPPFPVVWFEPNPHGDGEPWDNCFIPLSPSLEAWLAAWLEGRDLLDGAWERAVPLDPGAT